MRPPHLDSLSKGTYYDSYGTPKWIINAACEALGIKCFDIDMAADARNTVAPKYYSKQHPLTRPATLRGKYVWCNPPGPWKPRTETLNRYALAGLGEKMWSIWYEHVTQGAFLFFNADHLRYVECNYGDAIVMLRQRVKYVGAKSSCSFPSALVIRNVRQLAGLPGLVMQCI